MLNEHWESQEAVNGHRKAFAYTQIYQPKVLPLVTRRGTPFAVAVKRPPGSLCLALARRRRGDENGTFGWRHLSIG